MKKPKLSLCLAVFNEERNIHLPLQSASDLTDEIVIVDGGSTDKTLDIARRFGKKVRIFYRKNQSMFHRNKQLAIEKARGEWILQLDADEELTDELKKEIKNIINNPQKKEIAGYWIPRKNWFLTRFLYKGGQYPDYTLRLYRRGKANFPCQSVHENVKIAGPVGYLKNPILHYADPDFSRYLYRWDRYTTFEVEEILSKKNKTKKPSFFEYFFIKPGVTFFSLYFRHKGFLDGFAGFVFALFSAIRFWVIFIKWKTCQVNK
ncbi:MAG: glycosyltransferase family 2 protein [Patescibacteria group bacterium]|nr:glycosyltransferase family 2 protein [Patescibacteria group bacterium]